MLPFLGFSQQVQPKRVSIVVTAKEITPQKELVQLPADNVPSTINSKPKATLNKKTTYTQAKATSLSKIEPKKARESNSKAASFPVTKSEVTVKESNIAKTTTKSVANPPVKEEVTAKVKPAPKAAKEAVKPEKEIVSPAPIAMANTSQNSKLEETTTSSEHIATVKAEHSKSTPQLSPNGQINSVSYVWIGVFLIIAGVVLGLLFGKPAFLISFVGVVFVALGMLI